MSASPPNKITIPRPDDWHVHLRDGAMLRAVLPYTARTFARAIVMPNLRPPVTTTAMAAKYRGEILAALPSGSKFQPLMTIYLTNGTDADDLAHGFRDGVVTAAKLYPAHATTNSDHGVTDIKKIYPVLERMQKMGMPLLVHGEVTDHEIDIFDREAVFIDRILARLRRDMPELKIVFEHITTKQAVEFVEAGNPEYLGATITPQHLLINRNAMFQGGIRPHNYCLPVAKREEHRLALVKAATSGQRAFFLGTDSAPHPRGDKESACGCAGTFTAINALEMYATVFDEAGAIDKLGHFASENGPHFYKLPVNSETVDLVRRTGLQQEIKSILTEDEREIVVFTSLTAITWQKEGG